MRLREGEALVVVTADAAKQPRGGGRDGTSLKAVGSERVRVLHVAAVEVRVG